MEQKIKYLDCIDNDLSNRQKVVFDELSQTSPYFNLLHQQLVGALKDTDEQVLAIMKCLDEISHVTSGQKDRINDTIHNIMPQVSGVDGSCCQYESPIGNDFNQSPIAVRNKIVEVMLSIDAGNKAINNQLSEAFGYLQFQDVLRQRVEQVQSAILELDNHFLGLVSRVGDTSWDGLLSPTLKELMESHVEQYVMESQHEIYVAVIGNLTTENNTVSSK